MNPLLLQGEAVSKTVELSSFSIEMATTVTACTAINYVGLVQKAPSARASSPALGKIILIFMFLFAM